MVRSGNNDCCDKSNGLAARTLETQDIQTEIIWFPEFKLQHLAIQQQHFVLI